MKKKVLVSSSILACLLSTSCELKDELSSVNLLSETDTVTELTTSASWKITRFTDSGNDETTNFDGYSFSFNVDGSLFADSRTNSVEGTWSITTGSGNTVNSNTTDGSIDSGSVDPDTENNNGDVNSNTDTGATDQGTDNGNVDIGGDDNNNDTSDNTDNPGDDNGSADDDDDTTNDDCNNCSNPQLLEVLTGCSGWSIDKLERNDQDIEDEYSGYRFNFSDDGRLTAEAGSTTYSGTWESSGNGNNTRVTISVANIEEINGTWNLHEIELENGERKVDLRIGGDDRLRFENRCTTSSSKSFASGTINRANVLNFNIFFANAQNFNDLSKVWDIRAHSDIKIELIHVSNDGGGTDLLTFEKN